MRTERRSPAIALQSLSPMFRPRTCAAAAVVMAALWQWATVTANYQRNWTALYCTGSLQSHPPLIAAEHVYLFADSTGYDGQFYHLIAHDPFLRSNLKAYIDDARLRYRRILVPMLAYTLALGNPLRIDAAYELITFLMIGLGVYWSCGLALESKLSAAWGLLFLLLPAVLITLDRLVVDGALAALTAAFLYYRRSTPKLFLVLVSAALTRETGFLLIAALCLYLIYQCEWKRAGAFLLSGVPALAWYAYVRARTPAAPYDLSPIPFSGIWTALRHPWPYPPDIPLLDAVRVADYLALGGVLCAFGLAFWWLAKRPWEPWQAGAVVFAAMGIFLQRTDHWLNVYDFGRVYTPLLLCLAAGAAQYRKPGLLVPAAMMLPKLAIQITPQFLGVIHRIA